MLTDYLHTMFLLMYTIVFGEKAVDAGRSGAHVMVDSVAASFVIFILYTQYRQDKTTKNRNVFKLIISIGSDSWYVFEFFPWVGVRSLIC